MNKYEKMTHDEFCHILNRLIKENVSTLLTIPGAYEVFSEHFNNEILEIWEREQPLTIEILQHQIEYWYTDPQEMPEHEIEHVKQMIGQGYNQGQLVDCDNIGWWKIVNP